LIYLAFRVYQYLQYPHYPVFRKVPIRKNYKKKLETGYSWVLGYLKGEQHSDFKKHMEVKANAI